MTPLEIVGPDLLVILLLAVLLFGGTRLAGIGKGAGRAIREFKEETNEIRKEDAAKRAEAGGDQTPEASSPPAPPPTTSVEE